MKRAQTKNARVFLRLTPACGSPQRLLAAAAAVGATDQAGTVISEKAKNFQPEGIRVRAKNAETTSMGDAGADSGRYCRATRPVPCKFRAHLVPWRSHAMLA